MREPAQRDDAETQHREGLASWNIGWDDLRVFLACVEDGSFRRAAEKLGMNATTVARRLDALEQSLGFRVFSRLRDGLLLTQEGRSILKGTRDMERGFFDVVRKVAPPDSGHRGTVRISITEGLGTYWVMPHLVDFSRQNPFMILDLRCSMEDADVLRMEADLAIQLARPVDPDLVVTKLGRLHVYPFAAKSYVQRYGHPTSVADMANHRLVYQAAPHVQSERWAEFLGLESVEGIVGIRSNASSSVFYAIERGAGIGSLPTYAPALNAPVIPIDIGIRNSFDIWLTYHPDARKVQRVSHVIDWVKSIFSPVKFPWFRDEFIHPTELIAMAPDDVANYSVAGYYAATPFAAG